MDFRYEIQNMVHSRGISNDIQINEAIFGMATIGLLIGEDNIKEIMDYVVFNDKYDIFRLISPFLSEGNEIQIAELACSLIPNTWEMPLVTRVFEIVLKLDLKHIVLDLNVYDGIVSKECPLSAITWINNLVVELLKLHGGKTLYNSDCGTSDFIFDMFKKCNIEKAIGCTYKNTDWIISQIKTYFYNKNIEIKKYDDIELLNGEKLDMVYNTYPFMMKYIEDKIIRNASIKFNLNGNMSSDMLYIVNSLELINENGVVVALIPNGTLINNYDEKVRMYLVENDYIDTIISLPNNILPFTMISVSLVILKKNKITKNKIKMIDATDVCVNQRRFKTFTEDDIKYIINLYTSEENNPKKINVTREDIINNAYYLGLDRYREISMINPQVLNSVSKCIFRGYQISAKELDKISVDDNEESNYRIINIADINVAGFVNENLKKIKVDDDRKYIKYNVNDGDLIITAKNTTLKSAVYKSYGNYKTILTGNLIVIRLDQTKINPYYLKAFLDSKQGILAIKSIQTGTTIISLNPNSLKYMKIPLIDFTLQKEIANKYKDNIVLIKQLQKEYEEAINYSCKIFEHYMEE